VISQTRRGKPRRRRGVFKEKKKTEKGGRAYTGGHEGTRKCVVERYTGKKPKGPTHRGPLIP